MKRPNRLEYSDWTTWGSSTMRDEYITALEWYIDHLEDKLKIEKIDNPERYTIIKKVNVDLEDYNKERDTKTEYWSESKIVKGKSSSVTCCDCGNERESDSQSIHRCQDCYEDYMEK
jgi:hypothetical protein